MQRGDIITLSNGQKATIVTADTDKFKNIIIVELEDLMYGWLIARR